MPLLVAWPGLSNRSQQQQLSFDCLLIRLKKKKGSRSASHQQPSF